MLACGLAVVTGCPGAPNDPAAANRKLYPSYDRHFAELFDDVIDARAAGIALEDPAGPHGDVALRERTQVGDGVARVQITTVTEKKEDTGASYQLDLKPLEVLAGKPPGQTFGVQIGKDSPSLGILSTVDLTNKRFTAFVKTFVRPDGDIELHFHLSPDEPEVAKAVRDAVATRGL